MRAKILNAFLAIGILLVLIACSLFLVHWAIKTDNENVRLLENQNSLLENRNFKAAQSVTGRPLTLATSEIKAHFPEVVKQAKSQAIKAKQIESITQAAIANTQKIVTIVKDSIVHDTVFAKVTRYADQWLKFDQVIKNDTAFTTWQSKDSLTHLLYWRRPHRFLFVKYGRKEYFIESSSSNPHSLITNQLLIQHEK